MTGLLILIPAALIMGLMALLAFLWALDSNQFEDLEGAAGRILYDDPSVDDVDGPAHQREGIARR